MKPVILLRCLADIAVCSVLLFSDVGYEENRLSLIRTIDFLWAVDNWGWQDDAEVERKIELHSMTVVEHGGELAAGHEEL